MTDEPDNLVLTMLRTIRQTQLEHGLRLTAIEVGVARLRRDAGAESSALAYTRMDTTDHAGRSTQPYREA